MRMLSDIGVKTVTLFERNLLKHSVIFYFLLEKALSGTSGSRFCIFPGTIGSFLWEVWRVGIIFFHSVNT